jgi:tetrahydromethanopterin S-methyltransferase subunit A
MQKIKPDDNYPAEKGRFLRGNDFSPAAVAVILNTDEDKIPPELEELVRTGVESGAALSGTVQTPNLGFEKMICNIVANPNIRYLILAGPESAGHMTGEALLALMKNGIDEKKKNIGTTALFPYLYNISFEAVERFRKQITVVNLLCKGDPASIRKAVWSCFQEAPVDFQGQSLFDPGAYGEPPLSEKITWNVTQPWAPPLNDKENDALKKANELIEKLKARNKGA